MSASFCANKREILNRVKHVLETHVQSGVIDREDLKEVSKKAADAIAPPAAVEKVDQITLQHLVEFLCKNGADETIIAALRDALPAATTTGGSASGDEKKGGEKEEQRPAAPSATAELSLGAFQARMMKKREELRRRRAEAEAVENARLNTPAASACGGASGVLCAEARRGGDAAGEEPPARRHKTETHALPDADVDIYAGLVDAAAGERGLRPASMC